MVLGLLFAAFAQPSGNKALKRRMTSLRDRHSGSSTNVVEAQLRKIQTARASATSQLATRLIPKPEALTERLQRTGKNWTLSNYLVAMLVIFVVVAALLKLKGAPLLLCAFVGLFVALFLPHKVVGFLINRRINKFTVRFPDGIELLVRGLRSGLPISETISVVAQEVSGPVGEEFRAVADKMKIGRTMDAALQETADRLGTPEFQFFCITLNIQRETGGNLAETLSNLADVLRKRAQMKLKIKAMSSESKASAYIIGSLPFIVFGLIWMIADNYMQGFFKDTRLMIAGAGGLCWMSIGGFIMAKMINFEI